MTSTETISDSKESSLHCKLTTPELQARKQTVITSLRKQIVEKKPLTNGYAYRFSGNESLLDELTEFIRTERMCCDFFDFAILIPAANAKATPSVWLHITGPEGAQAFIDQEIEL